MGQFGEDAPVFRNLSNTGLYDSGWLPAVNTFSFEPNLTFYGTVETGKGFKQGTFAGPVGAYQRDNHALFNA